MALTKTDLQQVQEYLREHIVDWFPMPALQLNERIIRVEEELKHQRELMLQGFENVDRRFEDLRENLDRRFDAIDKRFEVIDTRFEESQRAFYKRFDESQRALDVRFTESQKATDKRFEELHITMNARFGDMNRRFTTLTWLIGIGIAAVSTLITVFTVIG